MAEAEACIVGDWKNFTFHMATPADFPAIAQHVRDHFLRGEPMNLLLGWDDQNAAEHDEIVRVALKHMLSFYMIEKGKNEIVACNLMLDSRLEDFSGLTFDSHVGKKILGLIMKLDENTRAEFQKQFPCEYYAEIFISSVVSNYRGQGIATEMYRRSIEFLKVKGYPVLKVAFSSPATRAIGQKLGCVDIGRIYFNQHVGEDGEKSFPNAADDQYMMETAKFL